jgi:amidophosphoribosyltransferase
MMTNDKLIGLRDPHGFKPLKLGRIKLNKQSAYFIASETIAFDDIRAEYIRDVEPNEMIILDEESYHSEQGYKSRKILDNDLIHTPCIFESVYFARPDSQISPDGMTYGGLRRKMGQRLAQEHPVDADVVISVPDSGNHAAEGYSRQSKIPFESGFTRNHYVGRTFIAPSQSKRMQDIDLKLNVERSSVKGKRIIVVDDSIVRGNTTKRKIIALKNAGAKEIHVRISCPPVRYPCFYGMDFPTGEELIANQFLDSNNKVRINDLCNFLGANSLGYLSLEGLLGACKLQGDSFCTACYNGNYPTK